MKHYKLLRNQVVSGIYLHFNSYSTIKKKEAFLVEVSAFTSTLSC